MKVWIVSLEWNDPPAEVTGDTGIVEIFTGPGAEAAARKCQAAVQKRFHDEGVLVSGYSMAPGAHCIACGELTSECNANGCRNIDPESAEEFCDHCGAELNADGSCDNDHDEWFIDVHCREYPVTDETRST